MSDETASAISAVRRDWAAEHRTRYLNSGGVDGHIEDLTAVGGRRFASHCLIKYLGRKSGKVFITGLTYADIAGEVVLCASKGGADHHPDWYLNLVNAPQIDFQIATQAFRGTWREPVGDERAKVWSFFVDCHPFYANYQESTERVLPLVMLTAMEAIPVFTPADATGMRQIS
jgi:deazaflavin-dependent oxidoreductase (nitroreductase family)